MIKGTVGLYQRETEWHPLNIGFKMSCEVSIKGTLQYRLFYIPQIKKWRNQVTYELQDLDGNIVHEWSQKQHWLKTIMDLSILPDYPLEYVVKWTGGCSFVTPTKKFPPYFTIHSKSKTAEIDGMEFEHHDFHSEINFKCEPDRMPQAILIANMLFNTPDLNSDDQPHFSIGSD